MRELPRLRCPLRQLGPVTADPSATHWQDVTSIPLVENVSGSPPDQATHFRIAHDRRQLRILFVAEDAHPWATHTERDAPLHEEEVVEVFLDPFGDLESYFEFEVNPNNAKLDLVLRRIASGYRKDFRWRCDGFESAVRITEAGWIAELGIPFASLGNAVPRGEWRANFYRIDRPQGSPWELSAWSPTGMRNFHVATRFGVMDFEARSDRET